MGTILTVEDVNLKTKGGGEEEGTKTEKIMRYFHVPLLYFTFKKIDKGGGFS